MKHVILMRLLAVPIMLLALPIAGIAAALALPWGARAAWRTHGFVAGLIAGPAAVVLEPEEANP